MAEFFDVGASRNLPWARRPRAAALLAAAGDPDCGFDAVVVGEFERAFASGQAPVDLSDPVHQAEREVLRNRFRTSAAMTAQVREQGRNVGGRQDTS